MHAQLFSQIAVGPAFSVGQGESRATRVPSLVLRLPRADGRPVRDDGDEVFASFRSV